MYFFKEKILGTLLDSQIIRMDTAFAFSLYYSNFEYVQLQFYLLLFGGVPGILSDVSLRISDFVLVKLDSFSNRCRNNRIRY